MTFRLESILHTLYHLEYFLLLYRNSRLLAGFHHLDKSLQQYVKMPNLRTKSTSTFPMWSQTAKFHPRWQMLVPCGQFRSTWIREQAFWFYKEQLSPLANPQHTASSQTMEDPNPESHKELACENGMYCNHTQIQSSVHTYVGRWEFWSILPASFI